MRKNLNYYLKLDYPIEIKKLPKKDGGGYMASIPQLGEKAFRADGRTIKEALANLRKVKKDLFTDFIEEGTPILEPEPEPESIFSGKFVVRMRPELHRQLVERAQKENVSLNHLVVHLLAYNSSLSAVERKIDELVNKIEAKQFAMPISSEYLQENMLYKYGLGRIGKVGR